MKPITHSAPSLGAALMNCLKDMTTDPAVFPEQAKTSTYNIAGLVQTERLAERGRNGRNRFLVGIGSGGDWAPIEEEWDENLSTDDLEWLFLEFVVLGDMDAQEAETWGFPGNDYTVTVEDRQGP
ncbi:hypothetical protein ACFWXI_06590 [[Kitasatospora] papulosa]|uniref:hypothetical protein n=1 Tax=[Kitasatospora] papulosa TaxID=1464011 RepID=UPI003683435F